MNSRNYMILIASSLELKQNSGRSTAKWDFLVIWNTLEKNFGYVKNLGERMTTPIQKIFIDFLNDNENLFFPKKKFCNLKKLSV